jgi:hypothetical protein
MKPVKQTILSDPENNIYGNCLRACLASILEVEIDSIPAFEKKYGLESHEWYTDFQNYLDSQNLKDKGCKYEPTEEQLINYTGIDGYYIVGGKSPRPIKNGHAVIYYKGNMVHDPHPSNDGLVQIWFIWKIERKND